MLRSVKLPPLLAPFFRILTHYFEAPATQPTYNRDSNLKHKWTAPWLSLLIFLSIKRGSSDFHARLRDFTRCTIPEENARTCNLRVKQMCLLCRFADPTISQPGTGCIGWRHISVVGKLQIISNYWNTFDNKNVIFEFSFSLITGAIKFAIF